MGWCLKHKCAFTGLPAYAWCPQCEKEPENTQDGRIIHLWAKTFTMQVQRSTARDLFTGRLQTVIKSGPDIFLGWKSIGYIAFFEVKYRSIIKRALDPKNNRKLTLMGEWSSEKQRVIIEHMSDAGWLEEFRGQKIVPAQI